MILVSISCLIVEPRPGDDLVFNDFGDLESINDVRNGVVVSSGLQLLLGHHLIAMFVVHSIAMFTIVMRFTNCILEMDDVPTKVVRPPREGVEYTKGDTHCNG